jgi:hypothetical protein
MSNRPPGSSMVAVRRLLLALLTFGIVATTADLLLLEHYEDPWQLVPLALNGLGLASIAWHVAAGGAATVRVLQIVMAGFLAAGLVGVALHYRGNLEFQLDINPDQTSWELFTKVMRAKAPPALAPGVMAQLGLLGLIYTYRHNGETSKGREDTRATGGRS